MPLFAGLDAAELAHVAAAARERGFDRGDIIILEGEHGGGLCFVRSGLVKVFKTSPDGREQVLRLIQAGETFNDVPALDGGPNPASAAALQPTTIYLLGRDQLMTLIRERPAVAEAAVPALATALRHLVSVVEDLSFRHVTARVAKILLEQERLHDAAGAAGDADVSDTHHLTQQEMAAMAGTAREMVGRALKQMEGTGAIEMRHGRAIVLDRERLRNLVW